MEGKLGKLSIIPISGGKPAQRILLAGLGGKKENMTKDTIRAVSGKIAQKAQEYNLKRISIIAPPSFISDQSSSVVQIIEGFKMSLYKFDKFKSEKTNNSPDLTIIVSKSNKYYKAVKTSEIIADGTVFTKSIANLPPNECTPNTLSKFCKNNF